jgi:hypothetical protein
MNAMPSSSNKSAWVQLYEARRAAQEAETRQPGRPPSPIPRHKVGFTLSQGEIAELESWQNRLSELLGRRVSTGETIGILTRICSARLLRVSEQFVPVNLVDLVEFMVGGD